MRRLAVLVLVLAASCAPRPAPPTPAPAPPPAPVAAPPPAPAPAPLAWEEAPLSEGDWRYRADGGGSAATFGTAQAPTLIVRCEGRQVRLIRAGVAAGNGLLVRTSTGDRALPATPQAAGLAATLAASDPLLDAMAFSRGRFAVEVEGTPRLVVPSWPEPARVVEDCRS